MKTAVIIIGFVLCLSGMAIASDYEGMGEDIKENAVQWPSREEGVLSDDICVILGGLWYNLDGKRVCLAQDTECDPSCASDASCSCLSSVGLCVCRPTGNACSVSITSPPANSIINSSSQLRWVTDGGSCSILQDGSTIASTSSPFTFGSFVPSGGSSSKFTVKCFGASGIPCEASITLFGVNAPPVGPSPTKLKDNKEASHPVCNVHFTFPSNGSSDIEAGTTLTWDKDTAVLCQLLRDGALLKNKTDSTSYLLQSAPSSTGTNYELDCYMQDGTLCGSSFITLSGPSDTCSIEIISPSNKATVNTDVTITWRASGTYSHFSLFKDGTPIRTNLTGNSITLTDNLPESDSQSIYSVAAYNSGGECARDTISLKGEKTDSQCDCVFQGDSNQISFTYKESQ